MTYLRKGSRGEAVRQVQAKLGITVDGIFGPQTEEAVKQFQRQKGLQVDGIVGPLTWNALFGTGGGTVTPTPTTGSGSTPITGGSPASLGTGLDKILGVAVLYGMFSILKKVL